MSAAVLVALLAGAGTALVLQRGALRLVVGFVLLGHAATVLVVAASSGAGRGVPLLGQGPDVPDADPLTQAFVLTAVVIAFAVTLLLLGVLRAEGSAAEDDDEDAAVEAGSSDDDGRGGSHVPGRRGGRGDRGGRGTAS